MPLPHFHGIAYADFPPADPTALGLAGLTALMGGALPLARASANPAIVVDKLRPFTQRIWQAFSVTEKTRFCRGFRTRWNTIRHRIAQSIHERLSAAVAAGKLCVLAGKIAELTDDGGRIRVAVEQAQERATLDAGWVVNCTGPQESYKKSKATLYQSLFDRGLVQADEIDMGIKVGPNFDVIDGGGYRSGFLFAIGPMLKGSLWETDRGPGVAIEAQRAAETILAALQGETPPDWFAEMWVDVVEYVI